MAWIRGNTPPDASFAVRGTLIYSETTPIAVDGAIWIPYFTKRQIAITPMAISAELQDSLVLSRTTFERLLLAGGVNPRQAEFTTGLQQLGMDYVYVGSQLATQGRYSEALPIDALEENPGLHQVYSHDGVFIYQVTK